MSAPQFEQFMADQIAAIEQSGVEPDQWIEANAEAFRASWEAEHKEPQ